MASPPATSIKVLILAIFDKAAAFRDDATLLVSIAGHVAIDQIHSPSFATTSIGGPPTYAGLMAKQFGLDVLAVTKVGYDFPDEYIIWLSRSQLNLAPESRSNKRPTTRFRIDLQEDTRILRLLTRCEDLEQQQLSSSDAIIVSGIANEISSSFIEKAGKLTKFLFLDPQTILRSFSPEGSCLIGPPRNHHLLSMATCLKADLEEATLLTGKKDRLTAVKDLLDFGIQIVLITGKGEVLMGTKGEYYLVASSPSEVIDTTGAGDIFAGAFVSSLLKTADPLWASCVALAASSLAVNQIGISKVPHADDVLKSAESIRRSGINRLSL